MGIKGIFRVPQLFGKIDGNHVSIDCLYRKEKTEIKISIVPVTNFTFGILISSTPLLSQHAIENRYNVPTGDAFFDETFSVTGDNQAGVLGLLNKEVRHIIQLLGDHSNSLLIEKDSIECCFPIEYVVKTNQILCDIIDLILKLILELTGSIDIKKMIINNINKETHPAVRLHNLKILTSRFVKDSEISDLFARCVKEKDMDIRMEAAKGMGEDGIDHLFSIIDHAPNCIKIKAIRIIADLRSTQCVDRLIHVFDMNRDNEIRIEIINACETIGTVTVNDFLVEKLSSREPDIRYASIKALASCGNKHAVEHLYDIARKTTGNRKIKREAAHAIEAIQSRLGDVEKGWLTLSETDSQEGALSVIGETEEGKLSLSGDEEE